MLLSGDNHEMAGQMKDVLEGYTQFHHFNRRELNLIEALRTLRMLHHAAWLAKRWQDPAFPIAFPWFGEPRYWEDLILGLREQLGRMQEEPIQIPLELDLQCGNLNNEVGFHPVAPRPGRRHRFLSSVLTSG